MFLSPSLTGEDPGLCSGLWRPGAWGRGGQGQHLRASGRCGLRGASCPQGREEVGVTCTRQGCVHSRPLRLTGLSLSPPRASFRPSCLTTASSPTFSRASWSRASPLARSGPPSFPGVAPPLRSSAFCPSEALGCQKGAPTLGSGGSLLPPGPSFGDPPWHVVYGESSIH